MQILQATQVQFGYDAQRLTIHDLSLSVPQGAIYGFLGHNGAGKSTTIRLLLGLMRPLSGEIRIFGMPLTRHTPEIYKRVGALIETPSLYDHLSATDNLRVTAAYCQLPQRRIEEVLEIVGLEAEGKKPIRAFSTGMKQRLGLAQALLNNPELLILDEPANGLDPQGIVELRTILQRLNTEFGKTIFLSSHILSEIEMVCSHVGIIKKGKKLFEGTIDTLRTAHQEGISVALETSNPEKTEAWLTSHHLSAKVGERSNEVLLALPHKEAIPPLIAQLVHEGIEIYEVRQANQRLEDLFLHLSEQTV